MTSYQPSDRRGFWSPANLSRTMLVLFSILWPVQINGEQIRLDLKDCTLNGTPLTELISENCIPWEKIELEPNETFGQGIPEAARRLAKFEEDMKAKALEIGEKVGVKIEWTPLPKKTDLGISIWGLGRARPFPDKPFCDGEYAALMVSTAHSNVVVIEDGHVGLTSRPSAGDLIHYFGERKLRIDFKSPFLRKFFESETHRDDKIWLKNECGNTFLGLRIFFASEVDLSDAYVFPRVVIF